MVNDFEIQDAMIRYGGAFVRALAQAAYCADEIDLAKLKDAFPGYWRHYSRIVEDAGRLTDDK